MKTYAELNHLSAVEFKRFTGVKQETFEQMVETLQLDLEHQGKRGGQNKLRTAE